MPTNFKVFDIRRAPSPEPERAGKYDKLIMYELDPMRRYIVKIPEEEFNEERMKEAVRADIEERAKWTGKEFTVE